MFGERRQAQRILNGDQDAAEALVRRHYAGIYRFLGHLAGSREDAQDLAQQTFLKAKEGLAEFRGDCPVRSWLFRIAYREYLGWLRSRCRRPEETLARSYPAPEIATDDALCLAETIRRLPEDLQTAFLMKEVLELSVREIAEALEVPEGTVKSRCHHARLRLRQMLREAWYPTPAVEPLEADNGL